MEAATETPPAETVETEAPAPPEDGTPVEDSPLPEQTPATERIPSKLFRYSRYVHVGEGAEGCEEGESGRCTNIDHFHAFVRLPNQFQQEEIRNKALAAKARRIRQLRSPETDAHAILEGDLDTMRSAPEAAKLLVDELVNKEFLRNTREVMLDLAEEEAFQTVSEDLERLRVLNDMDPEERPNDEFVELKDHIAAYNNEVERRRAEKERPLRASLEAKSVDELVGLMREDRIEQAAQQHFMDTYSLWEVYVCTLKPRPREKGHPVERVWSDINLMKQEADEIVAALDSAFNDLESALTTAGNG